MCQGVQIPDANFNDISNVRNSRIAAGSRLSLYDTSVDLLSQNARYIPVFKEHESGFSAASVSNLYVCAQFNSSTGFGGSGRTRTTGLTLIRGAL